MNKRLYLYAAFTIFCFFLFNQLWAQNAVPHWAKKIHPPASPGGVFEDVATDKHGNVYGLIHASGIVDVDGQLSTNPDGKIVLASWNCDGNFRWMKSIGGAGVSVHAHLEVDTMEGIYLFGSVSGDTINWSTDTTATLAQGTKGAFLMKYNTLGQMQWFRMPITSFANNNYYDFSASSSGDLYWFALLQPGSYNDGLSIPTQKYYAVHYNAAGTFQSAIPLDITISGPTALSLAPGFVFDQRKARFYTSINYTKQTGSLMIGSTPITAPPSILTGTIGVLAAFNKQGVNLWVKQATPDTTSTVTKPTVGTDGTIFLGFNAFPGVVFCGDTVKNSLGNVAVPQLMALDTNGSLLWVNRAAVKLKNPSIVSVAMVNNVLIGTGIFNDTLYWDNKAIICPTWGFQTYLVRANASTGTLVGLDALTTSSLSGPRTMNVDKNSNIYIAGHFEGNMSFGTSNFSSGTNWEDEYLVKYKNTQCNCDLLQPGFSQSNTGVGTYQFTYTGQTPYATISWDFGDGTPTTNTSNPAHTYSQPGTYPVCVTVTNGCGSNTTCNFLVINTTGIQNTHVLGSLRLYPNPAQKEVVIDGLQPGTGIEIFDVLGRIWYSNVTSTEQEKIDIKELPNGTYIMRLVERDGNSFSKKFTKE